MDVVKFFTRLLPPEALSGTKTVSPGCKTVLSTLPDHHSPDPCPTTVPLARTTKIYFLSARLVGPPACFRYHLAFFPGLNVIAAGLYTCPATITKFGFLGM